MDFTKLPVGTKVWTITEGVISSNDHISRETTKRGIQVTLSDGSKQVFDRFGRENNRDASQSVFLKKPVMPMPKLEEGMLIRPVGTSDMCNVFTLDGKLSIQLDTETQSVDSVDRADIMHVLDKDYNIIWENEAVFTKPTAVVMPTLKEGMLVEIYGRKPIYRVISYGNKLCIVTGNVISSVYSEKIIAIWEDNGNENIHEIITDDDDIVWEVTHGKNA